MASPVPCSNHLSDNVSPKSEAVLPSAFSRAPSSPKKCGSKSPARNSPRPARREHASDAKIEVLTGSSSAELFGMARVFVAGRSPELTSPPLKSPPPERTTPNLNGATTYHFGQVTVIYTQLAIAADAAFAGEASALKQMVEGGKKIEKISLSYCKDISPLCFKILSQCGLLDVKCLDLQGCGPQLFQPNESNQDCFDCLSKGSFEQINLSNCVISDAMLAILAKQPHLQHVYAKGATNYTPEALNMLARRVTGEVHCVFFN